MNAPASTNPDLRTSRPAAQESWFQSLDHERIALLFLGWSLGALLLGGLFSLWLTLKSTGGQVGDVDFLFQVITYHRLVLVFLFLVPAVPAILGYRLLPGLLGTDGFTFPLLSRCSLRFYVVGLVLLVASIVIGPVAAGWTLPTPLSLGEGAGFLFMAVGLALVAASWFATGLNFIVTVHYRRAENMGFYDMPLMAWGLYLGAYQLLFAGLIFAIVILYLLGAQQTGRGLFGAGSDPLSWQNYFWFALRPAAFFSLIPVAGVISAVVAKISRKPVTGYRMVVGSLIAALAIGMSTWGVHLAGWGQAPERTFAFSMLALLAVIPVALISYSWLATLFQGANQRPTATLFTIAFFLFGGATVLMELFLRSPGLGSYLNNTMFASAQLDVMIWGAVLSALLAGLHLWWPEFTGRSAPESGFAQLSGMVYIVGLVIALVPSVMLGAQGVGADMMVLTAGTSPLPRVSLLGWALTVLGLAMVVANLVGALINGEMAKRD